MRVLGMLALALSTAAPARAEGVPAGKSARASLAWHREPGAEDCISAERLAKAMERHLGYQVFDEQAELLVQGAVTRKEAPARYRAEVELRDRQGNVLGRREVETQGGSCSALDEALVLVLALAIDSQLAALTRELDHTATEPVIEPTLGPAEPVVSDAQPARPASEPPPVATPPRDTPSPFADGEPHFQSSAKVVRMKRTGSAFGLVLAVGSGLVVGLMPATAWDASFTLGFRTPSEYSVELSGTFFPFGRVPTSEGDANFRAGVAELRGCAPFLRSPVLLDGCVGLWNGVMRARASGFSVENTARNAPLSGATAQVRASWDFHPRFFARASAGLGVPFVRDRFMAAGSEGSRVVLHRMSPLLALLGLELGLHFR